MARDLSIKAHWLRFNTRPSGWRLIRVGAEQLIESRRIREWLQESGLVTFMREGHLAWLHTPDGSPLADQPDTERAAA